MPTYFGWEWSWRWMATLWRMCHGSEESDHLQINVTELEAVGHGVSMVIVWGFKTFILAVDSLTFVSWMIKRNRV